MTKLGARRPLPAMLAASLKVRIRAHEWQPGDQLPTEAALMSEYGVSRATVRQALKVLESQGLVHVQQGRGSFLASGSLIRAGLQELTSISATIADMGLEPGMRYVKRTFRAATKEESDRLVLEQDERVLDLRREILADGKKVAYSYDILPSWVFPAGFDPKVLTGSMFEFLEAQGDPTIEYAVAEVHAVDGAKVEWNGTRLKQKLFTLLDQLHYDQRGRPLMWSRSYFVEGAFTFTVLRTR